MSRGTVFTGRVRIGRDGEPVIGEPVGGFPFSLLEVLQNPVLAFDGVGCSLVISLLKLLFLTGLHRVDREDRADATDSRAASRADDRSNGIARRLRADKCSRGRARRGTARRVERVGHAARGEQRAARHGGDRTKYSFPRGGLHAATGVEVSVRIPRTMSSCLRSFRLRSSKSSPVEDEQKSISFETRLWMVPQSGC